MGRISNFVSLHRVGVSVTAGVLVVGVAGGVLAVNSRDVVPIQTSESMEYYNNADHSAAENFYLDSCDVFTELNSMSDTFADANEDSVGDDPVTRAGRVAEVVRGLSGQVRSATDRLSALNAPDSVGVVGQVDREVDYRIGRDAAVTRLGEVPGELDRVAATGEVDKVRDSDDAAGAAGDLVGRMSEAVAGIGEASSAGFGEIIETNTLPQVNAVAERVRASEQCHDLLVPVIDDDEVHDQTVRVWKLTGEVDDRVGEATAVFGDETAMAGLDTVEALAGVLREVADGFDGIAADYRHLSGAIAGDPVTGDVEAADWGATRFSAMSGRLGELAGQLDASSGTGGEQDAVDTVMAGVSEVLADSAATRMHVRRLAKPVNAPTAQAVSDLSAGGAGED